VIDFTSGHALNVQYSDDFRQCTSYISAYKRGLDFTGTRFTATSLMISNVSDAPKYYMAVTVPVFAGMTLTTGATAHAMAYSGNPSGYWKTFPAAKMFMQPAGGSEVEIGYVTFITDRGASPYTTISGSTTAIGLTGTPNHAVSYNSLALYCVKTAPHGMSYMSNSDITRGITQGSGGTFTVRFYKDTAATGVSASIIIGASSVLVSGQNGVTIGYVGMNAPTSSTGNAAGYINALYSWAWDSLTWGSRSSGAMRIRDGSSVQIEKSLIINNGGLSPIDVRRNSSLLVGDIRAVSDGYPTYSQTSAYDALSNYQISGNLSITGFSGKAVLVSDNSTATVGTLFVKHPLVGEPNLVTLPAPPTTFATPLVLVEKSSSATFNRVYAVTHPGGKLLEDTTGVGLWTSLDGTKWGSHAAISNTPESMMLAQSGSRIFLSSKGSMFAFDGGTAEMKIGAQQYAVFGSYASAIITEGSLVSADPGNAAPVGTRTIMDARASGSRKIMTRSPFTTGSQYLYGATATRTWLGTLVGDGYTFAATNIGAISSAPAVCATPPTAAGATYSAILGKGGSITN
jgi:hypothetical protein